MSRVEFNCLAIVKEELHPNAIYKVEVFNHPLFKGKTLTCALCSEYPKQPFTNKIVGPNTDEVVNVNFLNNSDYGVISKETI